MESAAIATPADFPLSGELVELRERVEEFISYGGIGRMAREVAVRNSSLWTLKGEDARHLYDLGVVATSFTNYNLIEVNDESSRNFPIHPDDEGVINFRTNMIYIRKGTGSNMARTILHELGHALSEPMIRLRERWGWDDYQVRSFGECLAEIVAAITMKQRGHDVAHVSVPYLAWWGLPRLEQPPFIADIVQTVAKLNGLLTRAEAHIQRYAA